MGDAAETNDDRDSTANASGTRSLLYRVVDIVVFLCIVGLIWFFLLPGLQPTPQANRRNKCRGNLNKIALALHNYHDTYKSFPPAYVVDETGQPMHSWRVLILPYLDQQQLYDQYNFDEPWDGLNNRKLIEQAPEVYNCSSFPDDKDNSRHGEESLTQYFAITGPDTIFPGASSVRFRDILDGTSNVLMLVECHQRRVAWTSPVDVSRDELIQSRILNDKLSSHPGGFQGALADGSVRFIGDTKEPELLRRLITIDDGEPIPTDF